MFGLGYVGAEDRLFVMDALRNAGRAQLSSFAGGAAGQPRAGPHPVGAGALQRGRLPAPVRPGRRGLRRGRHRAPGGRVELRGGHQPLHHRGALQPAEDARRVRRDREAGTAGLEGHRRDRHGEPRGRDLRQGRRRRARVGAAPPEHPEALRPQARQARVEGPADRRGPARRRSRSSGKRFPYRVEPRRLRRGGVAMPDRDSVRMSEVAPEGDASAAAAARSDAGLGGMLGAFPRRRLERAAGVGPRVRVRQAARGDGPADRLLRAPAPDGGRRARPRDRRPRSDVRRRQPLRAPGPRARLRLERHLGGPGHHRHLRDPALRAGRLGAHRGLDALLVPRLSARRSRCWRGATAGRRARPTTRAPGSETLRAERTKLGLVTARATVRRPAGHLHEAPLDLLPRGGLGARLRRS